MPETRPPTRITEKDTKRKKDKRSRDPRADNVGLDSRETERRSKGVGYAEDDREGETEHKTGRDEGGSAT